MSDRSNTTYSCDIAIKFNSSANCSGLQTQVGSSGWPDDMDI